MDRRSRRFLLLVVIAAVFVMLLVPVFRVDAQTDPIAAASERARAAGSYHFTSDVVQVTTPLASVANVGRATREQRIRLEGENDLRQQSMEMRLWAGGGSVLQNESAAAVRVQDGKTMVRDEMGVYFVSGGYEEFLWEPPSGDADAGAVFDINPDITRYFCGEAKLMIYEADGSPKSEFIGAITLAAGTVLDGVA